MQDPRAYDVNIARMVHLPAPIQLIRSVPVDHVLEMVINSREEIRRILEREDDRLMVIVGPCSIHDPVAALEYAQKLSSLASKVSDRILVVMRAYFDKPRTTVGWKGLTSDPGLDETYDMVTGLRRARELLVQIVECGLPVATEFVNPTIPQYLADLVSWNAVGARTVESQTHREVASGLSMPIGCKNGTGGNEYSIRIAADAIAAIQHPHVFPSLDQYGNGVAVYTKGNPWAHLVLRGGNAGPNYDKEPIALAGRILEQAGVRSQLVVDCSHGNSQKDHMKQLDICRDVLNQHLAGNTNIVGIMLESNLFPGSQKLNGDPSTLQYGVSVTDSCIGWEETEDLLTWAYDQLVDGPEPSRKVAALGKGGWYNPLINE